MVKSYQWITLAGCMVLLVGCKSSIISGAAEIGMVAAEERTLGEAIDDVGIYTEINHYFLQKDVNDLLSHVNVTVRQGRVLLTGQVKKQETAENAVALAWKVRQVREVINEIEVNPDADFFDKAEDEWTEKQVETRLTFTNGTNVLNYSIEVVNGVAYLLGLAETDKERKIAIQVARTTQGVRKVVNHLRTPEEFYDWMRKVDTPS